MTTQWILYEENTDSDYPSVYERRWAIHKDGEFWGLLEQSLGRDRFRIIKPTDWGWRFVFHASTLIQTLAWFDGDVELVGLDKRG